MIKILSVVLLSYVQAAVVADQGHPHRRHKTNRALKSDVMADTQSGKPADSHGVLDMAAKWFPGAKLQDLGIDFSDAGEVVNVASQSFLPGPKQIQKNLAAQMTRRKQVSGNETSTEEAEESGGSGLVRYLVYLVFASLFAWWYWGCDGKSNFVGNSNSAERRGFSGGEKEHFDFGLFQCFDEPMLCCLACCCPAVRWADTMWIASQFSFVVAFILYVVLYGLDYVGLPGTLFLAILCMLKRQRIREMVGLPHGNCGTMCVDFWAYCCCAPCAIVQEARQIDEMYGGKIPQGEQEEAVTSPKWWQRGWLAPRQQTQNNQ